jgi:hypothetical protein
MQETPTREAIVPEEKLCRRMLGLPECGVLARAQIGRAFSTLIETQSFSLDELCLLVRARNRLLANRHDGSGAANNFVVRRDLYINSE